METPGKVVSAVFRYTSPKWNLVAGPFPDLFHGLQWLGTDINAYVLGPEALFWRYKGGELAFHSALWYERRKVRSIDFGELPYRSTLRTLAYQVLGVPPTDTQKDSAT